MNRIKVHCILVEVAKDFTTGVLATSLLMIHNAITGREDNITKLTAGQQVTGPVFHFPDLDIKTGRNDTTLVQPTIQLDDNLTRTVVINNFEFINVPVLLHHLQEFDDDLGGRADNDLTLAALFGIVNAFESIVQHANTDHFLLYEKK